MGGSVAARQLYARLGPINMHTCCATMPGSSHPAAQPAARPLPGDVEHDEQEAGQEPGGVHGAQDGQQARGGHAVSHHVQHWSGGGVRRAGQGRCEGWRWSCKGSAASTGPGARRLGGGWAGLVLAWTCSGHRDQLNTGASALSQATRILNARLTRAKGGGLVELAGKAAVQLVAHKGGKVGEHGSGGVAQRNSECIDGGNDARITW